MPNLCPFLQSRPLYALSDCCVRLMRSVELVQAILLSYLFSCILLNLSAFPVSFLPIGGSTPKHNFLFLSYILFYFGVLPNLYPSFCPCASQALSRIVTTPEYFGILLHRLFLGITLPWVLSAGYYHIDYFGVLPHWLLYLECPAGYYHWSNTIPGREAILMII